MYKLRSTAKKLDVFFRIFQIATMVGIVGCGVGIALIGAFFLFDLAPETIGTGFNILEVGVLELALAVGIGPSVTTILTYLGIEIILTAGCLYLARLCVLCIRKILEPMKEGLPFHTEASRCLNSMAKYSLILGLALNAIRLLEVSMLVREYDLHSLLLSDKITHVTLNYGFDIGFLVIAAVFLLLSYVFRYGQELQQLSDETL